MTDNRKEKITKKLSSWQKDQADSYRTYIKTSAVGLEFGLSIVIGTGLGYAADKYFSSSPYALIIGALIGSIAAGKRLWLFSKTYLKKEDKNNDQSN